MKKLLLIFGLLLAAAVFATVTGVLLGRKNGGVKSGEATVLVWRVAGPVLEQEAPRLPFAGGRRTGSIAELYPAFRAARQDPGIRGLAVYVQDADFGLAKAQELRRQMLALRRAGKFVDCFLETAGEGSNGTLEYYLVTACESIHLAPAGDLNMLGLYAANRFFRGTFDKLKIEPEFHQAGRYKTAVETYTRNEYSPESEEAIGAVLDGYYAQIVSAIAEARRKSDYEVRWLIDGAPFSAEEALKRGLVDRLSYPDQFRDHLKRRVGSEPAYVAIEDYQPGPALAGKRSAVVFARARRHSPLDRRGLPRLR
jgi:protease-4